MVYKTATSDVIHSLMSRRGKKILEKGFVVIFECVMNLTNVWQSVQKPFLTYNVA